jgi:hypothetical protein
MIATDSLNCPRERRTGGSLSPCQISASRRRARRLGRAALRTAKRSLAFCLRVLASLAAGTADLLSRLGQVVSRLAGRLDPQQRRGHTVPASQALGVSGESHASRDSFFSSPESQEMFFSIVVGLAVSKLANDKFAALPWAQAYVDECVSSITPEVLEKVSQLPLNDVEDVTAAMQLTVRIADAKAFAYLLERATPRVDSEVGH